MDNADVSGADLESWDDHQYKWSDYCPLFGIHEDIAGAQCLVWNFSVNERAWQTVGSPVQGQQGGWELQHLVQRGSPKELSLCSLK